ncbi:hypothetical protein CMUS01_16684 [Colletotrichum musicola]|uniref:Uncharacterized protein n=1 Tax=Colletotrichum musicola TaxID=2175873 RepID=A0A8H6MI40_9PEZI|nr:hypothetical protein CMUS01_16684 [Colletotrichum musicola]
MYRLGPERYGTYRRIPLISSSSIFPGTLLNGGLSGRM